MSVLSFTCSSLYPCWFVIGSLVSSHLPTKCGVRIAKLCIHVYIVPRVPGVGSRSSVTLIRKNKWKNNMYIRHIRKDRTFLIDASI